MEKTINRYVLPWIPILGLIFAIYGYKIELSSSKRPFVYSFSLVWQVVSIIFIAYQILIAFCGC